MMGISLRAYARMRGCSLTAVQKAIASKRITTLPDGTIECLCGAHGDLWASDEDLAKWCADHFDHSVEPPWTWFARWVLHPLEDGLYWIGKRIRRRRR